MRSMSRRPCGRPRQFFLNGAHDRIRTDDPFLTMEVLYQLSYAGTLYGRHSRGPQILSRNKVERETRFELATLSLEG